MTFSPRKYASFYLLVLMFFLGGCSNTFKPKASFEYMSWQARQKQLHKITSWKINGVISVTYDNKRDSAFFSWTQKLDEYAIILSGPMNIGRICIIGDKNKVGFYESDNKYIKAKTPEELMLKRFGWKIPIANIRYWIISSMPPYKKAQAYQYDKYGHLTALKQNDWKIYYYDFQHIKNVDLPTILEIKNETFFIKIKNQDFVLYS
jgi:outer membrane lipoprotein LolB